MRKASAWTLCSKAQRNGPAHIFGPHVLGGPTHLHDIEPHQGLSNVLLLLVNEISDLAGKVDTTDNAKRVRELEAQIEKLTQPLPKSALDGTTSYLIHMTSDKIPSHRLQSMLDTVEAHSLAALLGPDEIQSIPPARTSGGREI